MWSSPEHIREQQEYQVSQDYIPLDIPTWDSFALDIGVQIEWYFDESHIIENEKRDSISKSIVGNIISYTQGDISQIQGSDRIGKEIIIVLQDGSTKKYNIDDFISPEKVREKEVIELESHVEKFELLLATLDELFQANENEWWKWMNEEDIVQEGELKGKNINEIAALTRETWKDILLSESALAGKIENPELQRKKEQSQERYLRMTMGIWAPYFRGVEVFKRSEDEVRYMIENKLKSFSSPRPLLQYFSLMLGEVGKNKDESSNKAFQAQTLFIKMLQNFCYDQLKELGATEEDYDIFCKLLTGREHEISESLRFHIPQNAHRDFWDSAFASKILSEQMGKDNGTLKILKNKKVLKIEDPLIGEKSPDSIVVECSEMIEEYVWDASGTPIKAQDFLSKLPGYDDFMCVVRNDYQQLSVENMVFISSLAALTKNLKNESMKLKERAMILYQSQFGGIGWAHGAWKNWEFLQEPPKMYFLPEEFNTLYQTSVKQGANAVLDGINENFDMTISGNDYLTPDTIRAKNLGISEGQLQLLALYNDIQGNGDWYERSDAFQAGALTLGKIRATLVAATALTLATGGALAVLWAGARVWKLGSMMITSWSRAQNITMGVNASIASWDIYPQWYDSFWEIISDKVSDVTLWALTGNLWYLATTKWGYEWAQFLTRWDLINRGIQFGDITLNGIAPELARQLAIRSIFAGEDIFDEQWLIEKKEVIEQSITEKVPKEELISALEFPPLL